MPNLSIGIDPSGARSGGRVVQRHLRLIKSDASKASKSVDGLGSSTDKAMRKASRGTGFFSAAMGKAKVGVVALGVALTAAASVGFTSAIGIDAAMAEASTLIEGTTQEMSLMRKEAVSMAAQFGGSTTQQVEAFYQAISAGAGDVKDAAELLGTANLLAKGGVTDITTSVDVLTTVTNAYAEANLKAAAASDTLFAGVKAGKTTVGELGSALGKVVPTAAKLGVSFVDVTAAIATLTLGGLSTAESVTGLKGALAGVLKPSNEAIDVAKSLGLEFTTTALKTKGLVGFMSEMIDKTGGNVDILAKLFGSVEALGAVLALTAGDGAKFVEIQKQVSDSMGATKAAADKVSSSLSDRLNVAMGKLRIAAEFVGNILLNILVPALELVVKAGELVISAFVKVGSDLGAVFKFISLETVIVAGATESWTDAVDIHNQSERDLKNALDIVDGSSKKAADNAIRLANANLEIARTAQIATGKELELARALITASKVEVGAAQARSAAGGGFFDTDLLAQAISDVSLNTSFLNVMLEENKKSIEGVDAAILGVAAASDRANGVMTEWLPSRTKQATELSDAILDVTTKTNSLGDSDGPKKLKDTLDNVKNASEELSQSMSDSFGQGFLDVIKGTETVAGAFKSMASLIIEELFKIIVVEQALASLKTVAGSLFGSGINIGGGGTGTGGLPNPFANGAAFSGGNVTAFANGGVVNGPTLFPMANGAGLMGEAGPEAVMPLTRGRDGKLGVKSSGGGGVTQNVTINAMDDGMIDRVLTRRMPQLKEMVISVMRNERTRGAF